MRGRAASSTRVYSSRGALKTSVRAPCSRISPCRMTTTSSRQLADERQVVGDEEHRHAAPPLQRGDQVEDLLLHRHVERAGRLVGDQQLRLAGDRHRDHHALLLAAREPGRDGSQLGLRRGQADLFEKTRGSRRAPRLRRKPAMLAQHLRDLEADAEHRVERAHRLLEDHRDLGAAQRAQLARRTLQQVLALENDPAARARIPRQQAQDRKRGHRLAAAGFAHQRHRAVLRDVEAHAFHRRDGRRSPRAGRAR